MVEQLPLLDHSLSEYVFYVNSLYFFILTHSVTDIFYILAIIRFEKLSNLLNRMSERVKTSKVGWRFLIKR